jgi:hypothetical protein
VQRKINDVTIHFVEHGAGIPLVALNGSGIDHREIEAAVEAVVRSTGLPKDLPGPARLGSAQFATGGRESHFHVITDIQMTSKVGR